MRVMIERGVWSGGSRLSEGRGLGRDERNAFRSCCMGARLQELLFLSLRVGDEIFWMRYNDYSEERINYHLRMRSWWNRYDS